MRLFEIELVSRFSISVLAALLSIVLLAVRAPDAFTVPQLWAEDGPLFWLQAHREGAAAIFHVYAGYLNLAPRVIAFIASWFSPTVVPAVFAYGAALLTAWSALSVASSAPQQWQGLWFALALLLPPMPTGEIWVTPTNIQWIMAPAMVFILLMQPSGHRFARINSTVFVFLSGLTGPFSVLALPITGWRLYKYNDALGKTAIFTATIQLSILMFFYETSDNQTSFEGLGHLADTIITRAFGGSRIAVIVGMILFIVSICSQINRITRLGFVVFFCAILLSVFLKFKNLSPDILDAPINGPRYFYVPHVMLLWCGISLAVSSRVGLFVGPTCLFVIAGSMWPLSLMREPREDLDWQKYAVKIGKEEVTIPIHPKGYFIKLEIMEDKVE